MGATARPCSGRARPSTWACSAVKSCLSTRSNCFAVQITVLPGRMQRNTLPAARRHHRLAIDGYEICHASISAKSWLRSLLNVRAARTCCLLRGLTTWSGAFDNRTEKARGVLFWKVPEGVPTLNMAPNGPKRALVWANRAPWTQTLLGTLKGVTDGSYSRK